MPIFGDFEKDIMIIISQTESNVAETFGKKVKDILFPKDEAAFVVLEPIGGQIQCHLLSKGDGGNSSELIRTRMVSFLSLMDYLESERLIYVIERVSTNLLFYQGSDSIAVNVEKRSPELRGDVYENINFDKFNEEEELIIKYRARNGYVESASCHIELKDKDELVSTGFPYDIKVRICSYLCSSVYPTMTLQKFIENNFHTQEELATQKALHFAEEQVNKAQESVRISSKTLIVAIITLLATIIIPSAKELFSDIISRILYISIIFLSFGICFSIFCDTQD